MADTADAGHVPLYLPAILLNPANRAAKQVEAHNAQQREKVAARRERISERNALPGDWRGKRVIRRKDNAAFTSNPHITLPTRADFYPSVPLNSRLGPVFPPNQVPRSSYVPSSERPTKDPFSSDSRNGTFGTSLKGVRAMLRKRGRRAEKLILVVEQEMRSWLNGGGWLAKASETEGGMENGVDQDSSNSLGWTTIDSSMVDCPPGSGSAPGPSRRLPDQHQVKAALPELPVEASQIPAVLELSRSPAHLTWTIADSFDRLVVHLLVRYYDLISWSEDHPDQNSRLIRLTHIVVPHLIRPTVPPSTDLLPTPETSDISDPSHSEGATDHSTDGSDAETEIGYSLDPDVSQSTVKPDLPWDTASSSSAEPNGIQTPGLEDALAELDLRAHPGHELERSWSHGSSAFGSSEAGSSDWEGMADSLELPPRPSDTRINGNHREVDDSASEASVSSSVPPETLGFAKAGLPAQSRLRAPQRGWADRPAFFDYLYGE